MIFPIADLPALDKGKGNKLIQIPTADLNSAKDYVVSALVVPEQGSLKVVSGKRFLTLKAVDIEHYLGSRAKRGLALPRGFQRVEGLLTE